MQIRNIAAHLRAPHTDAILQRRAGKGMTIDNVTRWGSTYLMIRRLVELKDVVQDLGYKEVHLTEFEWSKVERLASLLQLPYEATLRLQSASLCPGEFIKAWRGVIFQLEKRDDPLSDDIVTSLKQREVFLLANELILAGIWVDPRYRVLLTDDQKKKAKEALRTVYFRQKQVASRSLDPSPAQSPRRRADQRQSAEVESSSHDDFEAYLETIQASEEVKHARIYSTCIII